MEMATRKQHPYCCFYCVFPASDNVGVAPRIMSNFLKTSNPIFNSMSWLENVPVGSKIDIYVFERINGREVALCHGKATTNPWENQGADGAAGLDPHLWFVG